MRQRRSRCAVPTVVRRWETTDRLAEPVARCEKREREPAAGGTRCVRRANGLEVAREGGIRAFRSRPGGRVPVPTLACG